MRELSYEDIVKNNVDTVAQFKALAFMKEELDLKEFKVYINDEDSLKVVDKDGSVGYFGYDKKLDDIVYDCVMFDEIDITI